MENKNSVSAGQDLAPATAEELAAEADGQSSVDLDRAVAEKVMGMFPCDQWKVDFGLMGIAKHCTHSNCIPAQYRAIDSPRPYSTEIAAAMEVVSKMRGKGYNVILSADSGYRWGCTFRMRSDLAGTPREIAREADELPEAICKAALAAVVHNQNEEGNNE